MHTQTLNNAKTCQKHTCNTIPIFRCIFFPCDYIDVHVICFI